jgi:two-component system, NarL family, response regulator NreC
MKISLILADDHPVLRFGLSAVISGQPDFEVVAEASSGLETIKLVERFQPNVLVTDLMMPHLNGLEVARQLSARFKRLGIIVLSAHSDEAYVVQALRNGARGYVLKDAPTQCLLEAIRTVHRGMIYLSPPLSEREVEIFAQQSRNSHGDPFEVLTGREREVLQLTAEGQTGYAIASLLGISARTAENHRANLMRKLNLNNQSEVIRFALRRGLLPLD